MINITNKADCCGCGACVQKCPQGCITFKPDFEGFWYPEIDKAKCTNCSVCDKVCFMQRPGEKNDNFDLYAVKNKNAEIKFKSSSGGMFTPLAEEIIRQGGAVFGCGFDENFVVCHSCATTVDDLAKLRKSKYVQSDIRNTYKEAESALQGDKKVLFSALPCQIAGLKAFLQKDHENLYCVDLICSGVPSPLVWKTYLEQLSREQSSKINYANFRENIRDSKLLKPNASNITLRVCFENGNEVYSTSARY